MFLRHGKRKIVMVFVLLLAFTGQTLTAAVMPCTMMDHTPSKMTMGDNVHHDHGFHNAGASSTMDEKPCQQDSSCPMSSCMVAGILPSVALLPSAPFASEKIRFSTRSFASASIASLYRPPISR